MRIAVCDDNKLERELIVDLLHVFFENKSINYAIDQYVNAENMLYEIMDGYHYDVIFLDIYMSELLGIDAARKLRDMNYNCDIIFMTATRDFALDGYEVGASAYLLKSDGYDKISNVMERVLKNYGVDVYRIHQRNNVFSIPYNEIIYMESDNTRCNFYTINGKSYTVYKKLSVIENELSDSRFLRTHQSYLVNMNHIIEMNNSEFEMVNGEFIPIRQRGACEIRRAYLTYIETNSERRNRILQRS